jgi:DNA-binding Lrp family transcriptional regulator
MLRVFILVNTEIGEAPEVAKSLRQVAGVKNACAMIGPYDVIVEAEVADPKALAKLVTSSVQGTPGVIETLTLLALDS